MPGDFVLTNPEYRQLLAAWGEREGADETNPPVGERLGKEIQPVISPENTAWTKNQWEELVLELMGASGAIQLPSGTWLDRIVVTLPGGGSKSSPQLAISETNGVNITVTSAPISFRQIDVPAGTNKVAVWNVNGYLPQEEDLWFAWEQAGNLVPSVTHVRIVGQPMNVRPPGPLATFGDLTVTEIL